MGDQNTTLERVRRLVERLAPTPVCDECIADRIDDAHLEEVRPCTQELTAERGFVRDNDACGLCGERHTVIRKHR
ncbi:hypothetical protein OLX23_17470 [Novosphingobium sp. JCM 18896]|nr:hypothetical protein [Novosphingobium sp. JCM 18896]